MVFLVRLLQGSVKIQAMSDKDLEQQKNGNNPTDPQEDEKDSNVLGEAFDKLFGDAEGGNSLDEDLTNDPDKQESIKK